MSEVVVSIIIDAARISEAMSVPPKDPREYIERFYPKAPIPPIDHVVRTATPMVAKVNGGIWKALCECGMRTDLAKSKVAPGCVVWLDQPLGFCMRCGNQAHGRGWRPVVVPDPVMRAQIEAILSCRPNIGDRNWEPSETIEDLVHQNREHGDPVPEEIELSIMGAH